jgi:phosphoribosylamine--glycine ligase
MSSTRKVLVIGSGGREHALAEALLASPGVTRVMVLPGNAGTEAPTSAHPDKSLVNVTGAPLDVARAEQPDLIVIGPEAPLCDGLADALGDAGFLVYGPTRAAARLEGSKAFMKSFAERHGIRSARHVTVTDVESARRAIREFSTAPVIKADGLCAGKGVVVAATHAEAVEAAEEMLRGERFGAAGSSVVIEERLLGVEASVHAICDGERAFVLPVARDHKRIGDGDAGPNTGGMGTYAPAPFSHAGLLERVERTIVTPTIEGMRADGAPFRGTLFAGLMVTPEGEPVLLEFNVRFGDPETQVLLSVIEGDFAELLSSAARGQLARDAVRTTTEHAVCVVLAAAGYPGTPRTGDAIHGLDAASAVEGARVYHAGTRRDGERIVTSGGRVLGVTARAGSLAAARSRAYSAASRIEFAGMQLRRDIAGVG